MINKKLCPICGKPMGPHSKECRACHYKALKQHGVKKPNKLANLSKENYCIQCHKLMDIDRISAYCEECEKHIEIEYDSLQY